MSDDRQPIRVTVEVPGNKPFVWLGMPIIPVPLSGDGLKALVSAVLEYAAVVALKVRA